MFQRGQREKLRKKLERERGRHLYLLTITLPPPDHTKLGRACRARSHASLILTGKVEPLEKL